MSLITIYRIHHLSTGVIFKSVHRIRKLTGIKHRLNPEKADFFGLDFPGGSQQQR